MANEVVDITIKTNGEVEIDQQGYEGTECVGDIDELIKAAGTVKKVDEKQQQFNKQQWISQNQGI